MIEVEEKAAAPSRIFTSLITAAAQAAPIRDHKTMADGGVDAMATAPATAAELFDAIVADDGGGSGGITIEIMECFAAAVKSELTTPTDGTSGGDGGDVLVSVEEVVAAAHDGAVVLDVRSPGEFAKGHIPGAVNVPLFTDDERAKVGTAFAKQGRGIAMVMGMKCVKSKLNGILKTALDLAAARKQQLRERRRRERREEQQREEEEGIGGGGGDDDDDNDDDDNDAPPVTVYVHCWRGGMRSSSVTWFLRHSCQTAQEGHGAAPAVVTMDCRVMRGGYKSFRRWALSRWAPVATSGTTKQQVGAAAEEAVLAAEEAAAGAGGAVTAATETDAAPAPYGPRVCIVGGRTGVGKTRALLALRAAGEQVIDLEGLAAHSGSAFGWVGRPPEQPTSEHFSNLVACEWAAMVGLYTLNPLYPQFESAPGDPTLDPVFFWFPNSLSHATCTATPWSRRRGGCTSRTRGRTWGSARWTRACSSACATPPSWPTVGAYHLLTSVHLRKPHLSCFNSSLPRSDPVIAATKPRVKQNTCEHGVSPLSTWWRRGRCGCRCWWRTTPGRNTARTTRGGAVQVESWKPMA
jgi:tRNA 2-selenouridine synthase SelU